MNKYFFYSKFVFNYMFIYFNYCYITNGNLEILKKNYMKLIKSHIRYTFGTIEKNEEILLI